MRVLVLCLKKGCGSGLFRGVVKISFMSTIPEIMGLPSDDPTLITSYTGTTG